MALALVAVAIVALLVGAVVGWAWTVRGPARWCGECGDALRCLTCHPISATGRASARLIGRPPVSTSDGLVLTPHAAQRSPDVQNPRRRRST